MCDEKPESCWESQFGVFMARHQWGTGFTEKVSVQFRVIEWRSDDEESGEEEDELTYAWW